MDIAGKVTFVSNIIEENMKEVAKNKEPALDSGISSGDDGEFSSSSSSSEGGTGASIVSKRNVCPDSPRSRARALFS
jgi:hypothetical protein